MASSISNLAVVFNATACQVGASSSTPLLVAGDTLVVDYSTNGATSSGIAIATSPLGIIAASPPLLAVATHLLSAPVLVRTDPYGVIEQLMP